MTLRMEYWKKKSMWDRIRGVNDLGQVVPVLLLGHGIGQGLHVTQVDLNYNTVLWKLNVGQYSAVVHSIPPPPLSTS